MTYDEKLQDPRWQHKRLNIFNRDDWTCQICDCKSETLHAHHRYYITGREPWDYPMDAYITLCKHCHDLIHSPHNKNILKYLRFLESAIGKEYNPRLSRMIDCAHFLIDEHIRPDMVVKNALDN